MTPEKEDPLLQRIRDREREKRNEEKKVKIPPPIHYDMVKRKTFSLNDVRRR